MTRLKGFAIAVIAVGSVAAPAALAAPNGDKKSVTITGDAIGNYAFSPATVHVSKGAKVKWSWASNAPHNVTFKSLAEPSATTANGSYKLKFKQAGTYKYKCTIHGFKGKVVVG